jgi:mRNA-degrading endonuclease toxin of MazEF toxin-antitoxin module
VSYAKCEDIKSIPDRRLIAKLGRASDEAMFSAKRVMRFLLAM